GSARLRALPSRGSGGPARSGSRAGGQMLLGFCTNKGDVACLYTEASGTAEAIAFKTELTRHEARPADPRRARRRHSRLLTVRRVRRSAHSQLRFQTREDSARRPRAIRGPENRLCLAGWSWLRRSGPPPNSR